MRAGLVNVSVVTHSGDACKPVAPQNGDAPTSHPASFTLLHVWFRECTDLPVNSLCASPLGTRGWVGAGVWSGRCWAGARRLIRCTRTVPPPNTTT